MTVLFPDVSGWQAGLSLTGAPAVIAKASEGTTFIDPYYNNFKGQAAGLGIPFAAYHWLHRGNPVGEARHAFAVVGAGVPLMIDDETPEAAFSMATTLAFVSEYRRLGGTVTMEYLPRWYWQQSGSPDLRPLAAAGLALVSSNYASTGYSDTGPGWEPYGGVTPSIWQFTSSQPFNGQKVDFNGFRRGGVPELAALFRYGPNGKADDDMQFIGEDSQGQHWLCSGMFARQLFGSEVADLRQLASEGLIDLANGGAIRKGMVPAFGLKIPWAGGGSGGGGGATPAEVSAAMRTELNKTTLPAVPGKLQSA